MGHTERSAGAPPRPPRGPGKATSGAAPPQLVPRERRKRRKTQTRDTPRRCTVRHIEGGRPQMLGIATCTRVISNCSRSPGGTRYSVPPSLVGISTPEMTRLDRSVRGGGGAAARWRRRGGAAARRRGGGAEARTRHGGRTEGAQRRRGCGGDGQMQRCRGAERLRNRQPGCYWHHIKLAAVRKRARSRPEPWRTEQQRTAGGGRPGAAAPSPLSTRRYPCRRRPCSPVLG